MIVHHYGVLRPAVAYQKSFCTQGTKFTFGKCTLREGVYWNGDAFMYMELVELHVPVNIWKQASLYYWFNPLGLENSASKEESAMIDINQTQGSFSLKGTCHLHVTAKSFVIVVQKLTLSTE